MAILENIELKVENVHIRVEDSLHGRATPRPCQYALGLTIREITTRRVVPLSEFDEAQSQGQPGGGGDGGGHSDGGALERDDEDQAADGDRDNARGSRSLEDVNGNRGNSKKARLQRKHSKTFTKVKAPPRRRARGLFSARKV